MKKSLALLYPSHEKLVIEIRSIISKNANNPVLALELINELLTEIEIVPQFFNL